MRSRGVGVASGFGAEAGRPVAAQLTPFLAMASAFMVAGALLFTLSLGYGNDNDTYLMLRTFQHMAIDGEYVPSRYQGNIVPEFIIGFSASVGGYLASNLLSCLALSVFVACLAITLGYAGMSRELITLVILGTVANPHWIIAGANSMDYVHALAFFMGGILLLTRKQPVLAALFLALAAASRLSYAPLGLVLLAALFPKERERRAIHAQGVLIYLVLCGLFYLPVFVHSGLDLSFLAAAYPDYQGLPGLLARAVYKSTNLFALAGTIVLGLLAGWLLASTSRQQRPGLHDGVGALCWTVIGYHLVMFVRVPIEPSYLLPCVPAGMVLLARHGAGPRQFGVLIAAQLAYWFVTIEPLRIAHAPTGRCGAVIATGARVDPHLAPGVLVAYARSTSTAQSCWRRLLLVDPASLSDPLPIARPQAAAAFRAW